MEASDATQSAPDLTQTVAELLRLVERQQAELLVEGKAATEWRTRAELLDRRVTELQAELERARRPWWRFWR